MGKLVFRIRKKWFDLIVSGEKQNEYRDTKPFWNSRIIGKGENLNTALFLCGNKQHMREITAIQIIERPSFLEKQDCSTDTVYDIHLGREIAPDEMLIRCPHCGYTTKALVGLPEVKCGLCSFPMTIRYPKTDSLRSLTDSGSKSNATA